MHTPYNVLHIVSTNRLSGAERIVQLICRYINRDLFEPVIVCGGDPLRQTYQREGHAVDVCAVGLSPVDYLRLRGVIRERNIHLIHAHDHRASLLAWLSTRLGPRVPLVSHIHNANPWLRGIHPFKLAELFLRRRYDQSIACSEGIRDYYLKHNPLLNPEQIAVVANGIEIKPYPPVDKRALLQSLGIPSNHFIFGTVGRLDKQKGIDYLLPAFKEVANCLENVTLLIVGDGPEKEALQALTAKLDLAERVVFTGYRDDVADLFGIMDIFVLASRWEGLPIVLLEAMTHNLPIISANVGGVSELVKHGVTGLLVESGDIAGLADSMLHLYQDRDAGSRYSAAGRTLLTEEFDIQKQVKRIELIYSDLLGLGAAGRCQARALPGQ